MGFKRLYVVHPNEREVLGKKAYHSVSKIPDEVDMALVVLPRNTVPQIVKDCTEEGVKGIVIFSSGFGERGDGKRAAMALGRIAEYARFKSGLTGRGN